MTEHAFTPRPARESMSERASRRLRGALAENRIPQVALARALHLPQQTLSRKLTGTTAFTLDELETVAETLSIPVDAVLGVGDHVDRPIGLVRLPETRTAGGGTMFLPPAEGGCAPSGTRTPNPLIRSHGAALEVLAGGRSANVVALADVRRETPQFRDLRPALEVVQGGAA